MLSWSIGNASDAETDDSNKLVMLTPDQFKFYESMARIALGYMEKPKLTIRMKYFLGGLLGGIGATLLIHWLR